MANQKFFFWRLNSIQTWVLEVSLAAFVFKTVGRTLTNDCALDCQNRSFYWTLLHIH